MLRVPITFPPEKFNGRCSPPCARRTCKARRALFALFTTRTEAADLDRAATAIPLRARAQAFEGAIEGPQNVSTKTAARCEFRSRLTAPARPAARTSRSRASSHQLDTGDYTPWIRLTFPPRSACKVSGIARFLLTETGARILASTSRPINIDPERPALPISHPSYYAIYLAKLMGAFATLGMAEDTWALNEGVIDEQAFLEQA